MESIQSFKTVRIYLKSKFQECSPYPISTIYEALGLSELEAIELSSKTLVIRTDDELIYALDWVKRKCHPSDKTQSINYLTDVLAPYQLTAVSLGKLPIVNLLSADAPALSEQDVAPLREQLMPYFPHLLSDDYIRIHFENGQVLRLRVRDSQVMQFTKYYFELYHQHFIDYKEQLSPRFLAIKSEISDYLRNKYHINPEPKGFVQWFYKDKIGSTTVEFEIQPILSLGESEYEIVNFRANLPTNEQLPHVFEQDLHKYCQWKFRQQERINIELGQSSSAVDVEQIKDTNTSSTAWSSFSDLFNDNNTLHTSIEALRLVENPTINAAGEWIGRRGSKSIIAAWIDRLEECRKIKIVNRKELVKLLNNHFPGIKLGTDARIFFERNPTYLKAKARFSTLIVQ